MADIPNAHNSFIYVGTEAGGFYRRGPGHDPWLEMTNGLPPQPQVRAVVAHPQDTSLVYAGTQDGPYRSHDHGDHWERLAFPEGPVVWSLAFHPHNSRVMYLGTEGSEVYRSEDAGDDWEHLSTIVSPDAVATAFPTRILSLAADPDSPDDMYAALEVGGAARSGDGGRSWQAVNQGLAPSVDRLDVHGVAVAGGHVFISNREGVWMSPDKGDRWQSLQFERFSPIQYSRGVRVAPDSPSTLYACVGQSFQGDEGGVLRSTDLGKTWHRFDHGPSAKSTTFGVAINPREPGQVYFCTRRGQVLGTNDGGSTWGEYPLPDSAGDVISILVTSPA